MCNQRRIIIFFRISDRYSAGSDSVISMSGFSQRRVISLCQQRYSFSFSISCVPLHTLSQRISNLLLCSLIILCSCPVAVNLSRILSRRYLSPRCIGSFSRLIWGYVSHFSYRIGDVCRLIRSTSPTYSFCWFIDSRQKTHIHPKLTGAWKFPEFPQFLKVTNRE